jgi:hypothetical protein
MPELGLPLTPGLLEVLPTALGTGTMCVTPRMSVLVPKSASTRTQRGKWYFVTALTSNGEAANEVTLNEAVNSGPIYALTGMYDYIAITSGNVAPAGFWIDSTSDIVNQATISYFEAGTYV